MEASCPFMALSQALDKSGKSHGGGEKIPATCPVSGRRTVLDSKGKGSGRHSDEDEAEDEEDYEDHHSSQRTSPIFLF